jgi:hypothetical protein
LGYGLELDAETGGVIWCTRCGYRERGRLRAHNPSLSHNTLVVGVIKVDDGQGPNMLGIDATTGALRWKPDPPDSHAAMTGLRPGRRHRHNRHLGERGPGDQRHLHGAIVALDVRRARSRRTYSL